MKHFNLFGKSLIALAVSSLGFTAQAQLVAGYNYLQGNYVEVGVAPCGVYGTDTMAVAGYHPNTTIPGIGFVADPERDGWATHTVATMYDYCGDYFVPGSPVEGWALTFDGVDYINTDTYCILSEIPGGNVSHVTGMDEDTAVWVGSVMGMTVIQKTMVPNNSVYFLTRMKLINTTGSTMTGVYYGRNVDPDNEQPWSGNFTTTNQILNQPVAGVSIDALVSATGLDAGCYLGLGAQDSRAKVNFGGFGTIPAIDLFMGVGRTTTVGVTNVADEAVGLGFDLGNIAAGDSVEFSFVYILDSADLDTAMLRTAPPCALDPFVHVTGSTLMAQPGYEYQWVNCDAGFAPIVGAISQSYTATANGHYACILTYSSCSDTTSCTEVLVTGVSAPQSEGVSLSPNPAKDNVTLDFGGATANAVVQVLNISGQLLMEKTLSNVSSFTLDISSLEPGVYFVKTRTDKGEQMLKVVKSN